MLAVGLIYLLLPVDKMLLITDEMIGPRVEAQEVNARTPAVAPALDPIEAATSLQALAERAAPKAEASDISMWVLLTAEGPPEAPEAWRSYEAELGALDALIAGSSSLDPQGFSPELIHGWGEISSAALLRSWDQALRGESAAAARELEGLLLLSHRLLLSGGHGTGWINLGSSFAGTLHGQILEMLAEPDLLDEEALQRLGPALQAFGSGPDPRRHRLRTECAGVRREYARHMGVLREEAWGFREQRGGALLAPLALLAVEAANDVEETYRMLDERCAAMEGALERPGGRTQLPQFGELSTDWRPAAPIGHQYLNSLSSLVADFGEQDYLRYVNGAARVGVQLRLFELHQGRLPQHLEALVPDYIDNMPLDPWLGQPPTWDHDSGQLGPSDRAFRLPVTWAWVFAPAVG